MARSDRARTGGRGRAPALGLALTALATAAAAQEIAPEVVHQPANCTVPGKAVSVCAAVSDDGQIVKVRTFFRAEGERYFSFVEMEPRDESYCATLPAPREGRMEQLEYYLWAVDDEYVPQRTAPFFLALKDPAACDFPPLERDPERAAAITVYATNARQGDELDADFQREGVRFVPKGR
jgi:hypothetical protein